MGSTCCCACWCAERMHPIEHSSILWSGGGTAAVLGPAHLTLLCAHSHARAHISGRQTPGFNPGFTPPPAVVTKRGLNPGLNPGFGGPEIWALYTVLLLLKVKSFFPAFFFKDVNLRARVFVQHYWCEEAGSHIILKCNWNNFKKFYIYFSEMPFLGLNISCVNWIPCSRILLLGDTEGGDCKFWSIIGLKGTVSRDFR
jgi:hypothetical protein